MLSAMPMMVVVSQDNLDANLLPELANLANLMLIAQL